MTILITGGSKCGKSGIGERILSAFRGRKFYIATMMPYGGEAGAIIDRHRKMREGKGFETIERYTAPGGLALPEGCGAMLECVGNLCANEMFVAHSPDPCGEIIRGIAYLAEKAELLVIITNQVDCDGIDYPPETASYMRNMGVIHSALAGMSDCVIESVCGIPVPLKGGLPECLL